MAAITLGIGHILVTGTMQPMQCTQYDKPQYVQLLLRLRFSVSLFGSLDFAILMAAEKHSP